MKSADATKPDLAELELDELERSMDELGSPRFHAAQIYRWVYRRGVWDFSQMTDISKGLRSSLQESLSLATPTIVERKESDDRTVKLVLEMADGKRVESVFIPDTPSQTFCLSTQAGCAMGCAFCLTARMGLVRHLTAGEIVGQVRVLGRELQLLDQRFNIVLMGMGEPLHNYDETMKALRILTSEHGFGLSPRRITLSTVGIVPALRRLAGERVMPNLAVSLHGTTEEQRDALVPVNRKYPLGEILRACREFPLKRRSRITFEYVLLRGVNDSDQDARRLARLLAGLRAKVNVIPFNEAAGLPFARPSDERVDRFARILADQHLTVSVRKSRGRDIRAACGQLLVETERRSAGQRMADLLATS